MFYNIFILQRLTWHKEADALDDGPPNQQHLVPKRRQAGKGQAVLLNFPLASVASHRYLPPGSKVALPRTPEPVLGFLEHLFATAGIAPSLRLHLIGPDGQ